jgi:hypothetical protein
LAVRVFYPFSSQFHANPDCADLSPEEITQQLQLTKLKDKLWYVAPSVATDGTGIFEGLVGVSLPLTEPKQALTRMAPLSRPGSPTTSKPSRRNKYAPL